MRVLCVDLLTVSETATVPPQDDAELKINHPRNLALEATFVNHNFSQQVLKRKVLVFDILPIDCAPNMIRI